MRINRFLGVLEFLEKIAYRYIRKYYNSRSGVESKESNYKNIRWMGTMQLSFRKL